MLVSQFKKILNKHPEENWTFEFRKSEHTPETSDGKQQGWTSIVKLF